MRVLQVWDRTRPVTPCWVTSPCSQMPCSCCSKLLRTFWSSSWQQVAGWPCMQADRSCSQQTSGWHLPALGMGTCCLGVVEAGEGREAAPLGAAQQGWVGASGAGCWGALTCCREGRGASGQHRVQCVLLMCRGSCELPFQGGRQALLY